MKYWYKFYLWHNGAKGTEYTNHVVAPIFVEDRLDETLDTAQVVLENMPIATKKAFPPKTKFRLERYLSETAPEPQAYWDYIVEHDDVEENVGTPTICTHRLHLICQTLRNKKPVIFAYNSVSLCLYQIKLLLFAVLAIFYKFLYR